jgi:hypothetical protein
VGLDWLRETLIPLLRRGGLSLSAVREILLRGDSAWITPRAVEVLYGYDRETLDAAGLIRRVAKGAPGVAQERVQLRDLDRLIRGSAATERELALELEESRRTIIPLLNRAALVQAQRPRRRRKMPGVG